MGRSDEFEASYRGHHQPAQGSPLHDLTQEEDLPKDVYETPHFYTGYTDKKMLGENDEGGDGGAGESRSDRPYLPRSSS